MPLMRFHELLVDPNDVKAASLFEVYHDKESEFGETKTTLRGMVILKTDAELCTAEKSVRALMAHCSDG